jgi:hypothetical protein
MSSSGRRGRRMSLAGRGSLVSGAGNSPSTAPADRGSVTACRAAGWIRSRPTAPCQVRARRPRRQWLDGGSTQLRPTKTQTSSCSDPRSRVTTAHGSRGWGYSSLRPTWSSTLAVGQSTPSSARNRQMRSRSFSCRNATPVTLAIFVAVCSELDRPALPERESPGDVGVVAPARHRRMARAASIHCRPAHPDHRARAGSGCRARGQGTPARRDRCALGR